MSRKRDRLQKESIKSLYYRWKDACYQYSHLHPLIHDIHQKFYTRKISYQDGISCFEYHYWKASSSIEKQDTKNSPFALIHQSTPDQAALHTLYAFKACSTCAQRFKTSETMAAHLDQHFKDNIQKKQCNISRSRQWNLEQQYWIDPQKRLLEDELAKCETHQEKKKEKRIVIICDSVDVSSCQICFETLKEEWDDELQQWVYRNVMRRKNQLVHIECLSIS